MPWDERDRRQGSDHTEMVFSQCLVPCNTAVGEVNDMRNFLRVEDNTRLIREDLGKVFSSRAGPGKASACEVQNKSEFTQSQRDDHKSSRKYRPLSWQMWCFLKLKVLSLARETPLALVFRNGYNV